jgi:uncharacterized protein YcbK (DUF882 family)
VSRALAAVLVALALPSAAAAPPRFFVTGDGTLEVVNAHTEERARVRYRRPDGTYDEAALDRLGVLFRSRGDQKQGSVTLRLVEVLSRLQRIAGGKPLVLLSGYRSPDYNTDLKQQGRAVAGGSMHTEGLAADLAFPRPALATLWQRVRALDCCGAGYYQKEGFLHVDVGRPRFWEAATSRVDENLSAGNARLLARTEFDRYAAGETVRVTLHALTVPPVRIARAARLVGGDGAGEPVAVEGDLPEYDGCLEVSGPAARLRVPAARATHGRARLVLDTCEPRVEQTPATVETNPIELR